MLGRCGPAFGVLSTSGFHRLFATKPVSSETSKPERRSDDDHSSIWDSWPMLAVEETVYDIRSERIFAEAVRRLNLVKRSGRPFQSAISGKNIEMKRSPVCQQNSLVARSIVGLEVAPAGLAIINPESSLTFDCHEGEPVIVRGFTKRTTRSAVPPAGPTATAGEVTQPAGVNTDELPHCRRRTAGGAVRMKPLFLLAPTSECF